MPAGLVSLALETRNLHVCTLPPYAVVLVLRISLSDKGIHLLESDSNGSSVDWPAPSSVETELTVDDSQNVRICKFYCCSHLTLDRYTAIVLPDG